MGFYRILNPWLNVRLDGFSLWRNIEFLEKIKKRPAEEAGCYHRRWNRKHPGSGEISVNPQNPGKKNLQKGLKQDGQVYQEYAEGQGLPQDQNLGEQPQKEEKAQIHKEKESPGATRERVVEKATESHQKSPGGKREGEPHVHDKQNHQIWLPRRREEPTGNGRLDNRDEKTGEEAYEKSNHPVPFSPGGPAGAPSPTKR